MLAGSLRRRCLAPKKTFFGDWRPGLLFDSGHATAERTEGRGKAPPNKGAYSNKPESREQSNNQQRNGQQPLAPPGRASRQPVATGRGNLTVSPGLQAGVSLPCPLPARSGASNTVLWPGTILLEVLSGLGCSAALAVPHSSTGDGGQVPDVPGSWAGLRCPTHRTRQHQRRDCGTAGVSLIRLLKISFCQDKNNKKPPFLLVTTS